MERFVVTQVFEIKRVILKMSLFMQRPSARQLWINEKNENEATDFELIRIEHLHLKLLDPRFSNGTLRDRPQCVLHSITECFDLFHVEIVLLNFAPSRSLLLLNPGKYGFVAFGTFDASDNLVLAPMVRGNDE
jgi:hypothetical protein